MELLQSFGLIAIGLVGLVVGGELLVRGASGLAFAARISPLVIGITVVSFGTSAPELAVTVQAAMADAPDLAVGNVVGSNIANVLLILGASALVAPVAVKSQVVKIDLPIVLAASVGLWLLSLDGLLSGWEGLGMLLALIVYLAWSVFRGKSETNDVQDEFAEASGAGRDAGSSTAKRALKQAALVIAGLALLVVAARFMVSGAGDIARQFGVSELIIGLTIVAIGTSLPELMASVVASRRGEGDIAVGNAVGSNLFNILAVLGIGAMIAPGGIPVDAAVLHQDMPIMIAVAFLCLPVFFSGFRISRLEGGVMLGYFAAYILYLVMTATDAEYIRSFEFAMLAFVIPLTLLAIAFGLYQSIQRRRSRRSQRGGTDA